METTTFDFFESLPSFVFVLAFFVVFVIFLFGGFVLLTGKNDIEKVERGRRVLLNSLYALFITLLVAFVFFSVTYLLQRGEALRPPEAPGEFPASPAVNFPPPPQFIKIGNYSFAGPQALKKNNLIENPALYAILCKKNEEYDPSPLAKGDGYDIIYIGGTGGKEQLLNHKQYGCWMENCNRELKNLYLAVFWTSIEQYTSLHRKEITNELREEIFPPCLPPEM